MSIETMKMALDFVEWFARDDHSVRPVSKAPEIAQALRQAIEQAQKQEPVAWGVDWGKTGDIPCVSIIKRLPDGGIEVLACEYAPYSYTSPPQRQPLTEWQPIEQMYPQAKAIDILMADGSILCAVLPQFDGDLWWEGAGTGEKFIDPKYASVTHWRIHEEAAHGIKGEA